MSKFLDYTGLEALVEQIKSDFNEKVDKEEGKVLSSNDFTNEYKNKLDSIADDATKVTIDDSLKADSTNPVQNKVIKTELDKKLNTSLKGAPNGVAGLGSDGKVPAAQLPGFVDDIVEGYLNGEKFYKESAHTTAIDGESDKLYVDLATNKVYRWSSTAFVEVSASLALGTTSSTAFPGNKGQEALEHAQSPHAPSDAEPNQNAFGIIDIGGTKVTAGSETDTFTIAKGSNITLTADATGKKVTIAATNTTYTDATQSKSGLMSGTDKKKLDEIAAITTEEIEALFA